MNLSHKMPTLEIIFKVLGYGKENEIMKAEILLVKHSHPFHLTKRKRNTINIKARSYLKCTEAYQQLFGI